MEHEAVAAERPPLALAPHPAVSGSAALEGRVLFCARAHKAQTLGTVKWVTDYLAKAWKRLRGNMWPVSRREPRDGRW